MAIKRRLREEDQLLRLNSGRSRKKIERRDFSKGTASQAVMSSSDLVTLKRTSKKINYDALKDAFDSQGNFAMPSALRGEADTYPMPTGNLSVGMDRMLPPTGLPTTSVLTSRHLATSSAPAPSSQTSGTTPNPTAVSGGDSLENPSSVTAPPLSSPEFPVPTPVAPSAKPKRGRANSTSKAPTSINPSNKSTTASGSTTTATTTTTTAADETSAGTTRAASTVAVNSSLGSVNIPSTLLPMFPSAASASTSTTVSAVVAASMSTTAGKSKQQAVPATKRTALVGVKSKAALASEKAAKEEAAKAASAKNNNTNVSVDGTAQGVNTALEQEYVYDDNTAYVHEDDGDDERGGQYY